MNLLQLVKKQIALNPNLLYLRGSPWAPTDEASQRAVAMLDATGMTYTYVDVDNNSEIARTVQMLTGSSRFPQFFCAESYIGGVEKISILVQQGDLDDLMEHALERKSISPSLAPA